VPTCAGRRSSGLYLSARTLSARIFATRSDAKIGAS